MRVPRALLVTAVALTSAILAPAAVPAAVSAGVPVASAVASAAVPATVRAARPGGGIAWRPCPEIPAVQCATLRLPVDWSDAYGPTFALALARRPATDPARRTGSLVVNPGGPGGSGVDFALDADRFFSPALRSRFDIVGFDPRGVGRSNPVRCSLRLVGSAPNPLLGSRAAYRAAIAYNKRLAADCRRHTGPMFGHVDTASVVRDIDALRAALGEDKLTFYGASYGTLMGQQYAQRYPRRVRAIAMDSTIDHSAGVRDFFRVETDAVQDSFDEFVAWCARDRSCVLRGRDVVALWETLLRRAQRGQLRDPIDPSYRMTVLDLVGVAFTSFYDPQWYALAYYLDAAATGRVRPDGPAEAALARIGASAREARATAWSRPSPGGTATARGPQLVENPFPAVFCEDWSFPLAGYDAYAAEIERLRTRAPQMIVSPLALSAVVGCLGWPSRPDNPQRDLSPVRTGPLLLINSRHDPATAFTWAQHVAKQLGPAATLVAYDGWGHVAYGRSACLTGIVDRYLITLAVPARDARCAPVLPDPFGVGRAFRPESRPRAKAPAWSAGAPPSVRAPSPLVPAAVWR